MQQLPGADHAQGARGPDAAVIAAWTEVETRVRASPAPVGLPVSPCRRLRTRLVASKYHPVLGRMRSAHGLCQCKSAWRRFSARRRAARLALPSLCGAPATKCHGEALRADGRGLWTRQPLGRGPANVVGESVHGHVLVRIRPLKLAGPDHLLGAYV